LFVIAGSYEKTWTFLGQLRLILGKKCNLIDSSKHAMFWVTNFPMFEWNEEEKKWDAKHHPFTSPQENWENIPIENVRARAYDLVYNGEELGGGSIRIHNAKTQQAVFNLLGINEEKAKERFGCLLQAQSFGYPPDGGIAFGLDRLVMFFSKQESLRDVIAFPKTNTGTCLMMQTPSVVEEKQLNELKIQLKQNQ
jgi:aspartyl-tRNA synthetase